MLDEYAEFFLRLALTLLVAAAAQVPDSVVWTFDSLEKIGGLRPLILGHPRVADSAIGKVIAALTTTDRRNNAFSISPGKTPRQARTPKSTCFLKREYAKGGLPLLNCEKLHALDKWYVATVTYDCKRLRNDVNGDLRAARCSRLNF